MSNKKFNEECLKEHNNCRKKHGVSALKLNKDMCAVAQKWADHLAKSNTFQHNPERNFKGEKMGENIAMKWTSAGGDFSGQACTQQWYEEVQRYDFGRNTGPSTSHFTQIVWKNSKELGVGRAQTSDGKWIVVGNYLPAGNYMGQNAENVFPPKDGKIVLPPKDSSADGAKGSAPVTTTMITHKPEFHSFGGPQSSSRTVTSESKGGAGFSRTVVTETTVGPDGKSRTVTREVVTNEGATGGPSSDLFSRFNGMTMNDASPSWDKRNESYTVTKTVPKEEKKEKKPQKLKDFIDEVIKLHNKYRKNHGKVGDLKHNKELTVLAQRWADHLAASGILKHSNDTYKGQEVGENVASRWSTGGADYTGQELVDQWYSEAEKYDYPAATFQQGTGHFSQVVWKSSKEIGIGKAHSRDGKVFVVCNYFPAGNMLGHFADNVFPPKK